MRLPKRRLAALISEPQRAALFDGLIGTRRARSADRRNALQQANRAIKRQDRQAIAIGAEDGFID